VKELYNENYKTLKKEIEKNIRRWKDLPCSYIGRNNIEKIAILLKAANKFNALHQNLNVIPHRNRKINLKIHMKM
jgi:hypothetical protein